MDEITTRIRDMYEKFPYPAGNPVTRVGNDVELALSAQARQPASKPKTRHVLDAGCGRGLGIIGAATLQPDVQFLGVDINRVAIAEAEAAVRERGLKNVRFQEADLMTLEGVEAPGEGFDVIHSSGVVHHLSDPSVGMGKLCGMLAPHGVINFMVYAHLGRRPLAQAAAAIDLVLPDELALPDRVMPARTIAALAKHHVLAGTDWENTYETHDVEFVDRLLNVNETDYDVPGLWKLLEQAGLRFLRWLEPGEWSADRIPEGQLRKWVEALDPVDRYRFVELIFRPTKMELLVCREGNEPRTDLDADGIAKAALRLNPELVVRTGVRRTPAGARTETLELVLRARDPLPLAAGPYAAAMLALKDRDGTFTGKQALADLQRAGIDAASGREVLLDMVRREILFRPWA